MKGNIISTKIWKDHFERWKSSGLLQADYCKMHALKPKRFSYWKCRFSNEEQLIQSVESTATALSSSAKCTRININNNRTVEFGLALNFPNGLNITGINQSNLNIAIQLVKELC